MLPVRALALFILLCGAASLHAQWLGGDYVTYGIPQVNFAANNFLNFAIVNSHMARGNDAATRSESRAAAVKTQAPTAAVLKASGSPQPQRSAAELAARMPAAHRERMTGIYVQAFEQWGQLAHKLGLPPDDLAGASAAFIAGNLMAMRDEVVPDEHFLALVRQLRSRLADNPALAQAGAREKRAAYEQLAMVGMFMATSQLALQRQPNPQAEPNFRQAGRANLQQVLNVDPDTLRIGPTGLE